VAAVEDAVIVGVVEDLSAEGESNAVVARVAVLSGEEQRFGAKTRHVSRGIFASM
jgi:hypothetical protein